MSLNKYKSLTALLPVQVGNDDKPVMYAEVSIDRDGDTIIKIGGSKNSNLLMNMILSDELAGFAVVKELNPKPFPGDNVEVIYDGGKEVPAPAKCPEHKPVQHRDGAEPWCNRCSLTENYGTPVSRLPAGYPRGDQG